MYSDVQIRCTNNSHQVELIPITFHSTFSDIVEIKIAEVNITIKRFNENMEYLGSKNTLVKPKLTFNQTNLAKNFSLDSIRFTNTFYLKLNFYFEGKIKYKNIFLPIIYQEDDAIGSISDIVLETKPKPFFTSFESVPVILGLILTMLYFRNRKKRIKHPSNVQIGNQHLQ